MSWKISSTFSRTEFPFILAILMRNWFNLKGASSSPPFYLNSIKFYHRNFFSHLMWNLLLEDEVYSHRRKPYNAIQADAKYAAQRKDMKGAQNCSSTVTIDRILRGKKSWTNMSRCFITNNSWGKEGKQSCTLCSHKCLKSGKKKTVLKLVPWRNS